MTTLRRRLSFALVTVLVAAAYSCGAPDAKKNVARVDAAETAEDQEVLDQLRTAGSNLSKPHHIDFYLYLPSEGDAQAAEAELRSLGYTVTVREGPDSIHWLCLASRTMVPTVQGLTEARVVFKGLAQSYKGAYDGWQAAIER
jgi:rhodanese-related sulfurtransferase